MRTINFITLFLVFFSSANAQVFTITNVSPASAYPGQTLDVTITCGNTRFTQGSPTVNFGLAAYSPIQLTINSITVISDTTFKANITVPSNSPGGPYTLQMVWRSNYRTLTNAFVVIAPYIVGVSPSAIFKEQTLDVIITGQFTHFDQGSSTINFYPSGSLFSMLTINSVSALSPTSLKLNITAPSNALEGSYDLGIAHSLDGNLGLKGAISVQHSSIASISPDSVPRGQTLNITINGNYTHFIQGSTTVSFDKGSSPTGDVIVNTIYVNTPNKMTVNITIDSNAEVRSYYTRVASPVDGSLSAYFFPVTGPRIVSVNPSYVDRGRTLNVNITGSNSFFNQGTGTSVSFYRQGSPTSYITVNSTTAIDAWNMTASINVSQNATTGPFELRAKNNNTTGDMRFANFYINNPQLTSISPTSFERGKTLDVTVTGYGTNFTQGTQSITFSPTSYFILNSFKATNDTIATVNVTVPLATPKGYNYRMNFNSAIDGIMYSPYFSVIDIQPSIVSVSPTWGAQGQVLNITITGQNTYFNHEAMSSIYVHFFRQVSPTYDITLTDVSVLDDQTIKATATIANYALGYYSMYISDSIGSMILNNCFNVTYAGVNETGLSRDVVKVYPNPGHEAVNIETDLQNSSPVEMEIMNVLGEKVYERIYIPDHSGKNVIHLNLKQEALNDGIYFIRMKTENGSFYAKFQLE
ncbi:MAG: T9SS type A sorting domain-containing protein [Bacteroidia bacterium]